VQVLDCPATCLVKNEGRADILFTIPTELRQRFDGRRYLRRSMGASGFADAAGQQHTIFTGVYTWLEA